MRKMSILFVLLCFVLPAMAQDEQGSNFDCSTSGINQQIDSWVVDYRAQRGAFDPAQAAFAASNLESQINELLASCAIDTTTAEEAQNNAPVDLSTLDLTAGSPEEICKQAIPAINPPVNRFAAPEEVLEQGVDYQAIFCTDAGAIHLDLFEEQAPITVNNMVFLAQNNFYNNTIFHRVIADFMAQGGDPTGTGRGGPGYQFRDETQSGLSFGNPYLLAMANAGPNTNGSQFFITFAPTPWLDGGYTIFGEVLSGQDVVDSIILRDPQVSNAPATTLLAVVIVTPEQVTQ